MLTRSIFLLQNIFYWKNCKCQIFWVGISLLLFIVVLLIFNCSLFLWLRTSVIFTFCNHWPIDYTCCWTMFCHKKIVLENKNFDEKYMFWLCGLFFFFKQVYKLWIFHCISRIWINIHIWGWGYCLVYTYNLSPLSR